MHPSWLAGWLGGGTNRPVSQSVKRGWVHFLPPPPPPRPAPAGAAGCVYNDTAGAHSPIYGVMADGIPLYGKLGDSGVAPTNLDDCGGHTDATYSFYHVSIRSRPCLAGHAGHLHACSTMMAWHGAWRACCSGGWCGRKMERSCRMPCP